MLGALRSWLDSWRGIGDVERGMACQGFDLQLTRYDEKGWRATFYTTGMEHSPTSATGTGWERTPWRAVQSAGCPFDGAAPTAEEWARYEAARRTHGLPGRVIAGGSGLDSAEDPGTSALSRPSCPRGDSNTRHAV